jgi:hypothetical protein
MAITNISKPSTSLTNPTKVVQYETWDSLTTTWDTETRTWDEMGTTWTNTSINASDWFFSNRRFPFTEATPFLSGGMTNQAKP